MLSNEKDLNIKLRGNSSESGKKQIPEEARGRGEARDSQEGATPSTQPGRD